MLDAIKSDVTKAFVKGYFHQFCNHQIGLYTSLIFGQYLLNCSFLFLYFKNWNETKSAYDRDGLNCT